MCSTTVLFTRAGVGQRFMEQAVVKYGSTAFAHAKTHLPDSSIPLEKGDDHEKRGSPPIVTNQR